MMTSSTDQETLLKGMRVLVVEDSFLIAGSLRRMLVDLGCRVVGPVANVADAIELLEREGCDAAILDINLGAETSVPIAAALKSRQTPFIFVTGYSSPALGDVGYAQHRRLRKPLSETSLQTAMLEEFVKHG